MQIQDRAHNENRLKIIKITFHDCYNNNIIWVSTRYVKGALQIVYIIIQCAFMKLIFYVENNMMALCDWACAVFLHSMWFLVFCVERTFYAITKKKLFIYRLHTIWTAHNTHRCVYGKLLMFLLLRMVVRPFHNSYVYTIIIVNVQRCVIFDHIMREYHIIATGR